MPERHLPQRKSPRLQGYDYAQSGAYFVTICTHHRQHLFGDVVGDAMKLNELGERVQWHWYDLPNHFQNIKIDVFVVMPNHIHGVIFITDDVGMRSIASGIRTNGEPADGMDAIPTQRPKLGTIVGTFKASVTRDINRNFTNPPGKIWQSRFHDHIICDEADLNRIREYTIYNPAKWECDTLYSHE